MKVKAHCFTENGNIKPDVFKFNFKGWDVSVIAYPKKDDKCLMLEISKMLSEEEVSLLKMEASEEGDREEIFSRRIRPFKEILTETAHLVEGLLSIFFISVPPKFDTSVPIVNIIGENKEEIELLDSDLIVRGFGYVEAPKQNPRYILDDSIKDVIPSAIIHLPAFSFFSQAIRSLKDNDNELAFFLFFRIIDGYFADGATKVEKALLSKANEIEKFLPYTDSIKKSTKSILEEMNIKSKSQENYKGLISDIVMIRHKLTHFSARNASFHHSAKIKFDLYELNNALYNCCFEVLRSKVSK